MNEPEQATTEQEPCHRCEYEVQCARCGSSLDFIECWDCGGDGGWDDEEDGWCACEACDDGRNPACLSGAEWCEANPLPGCVDVARATPEEFVSRPCAKHAAAVTG